jgi:shikimate 5-dehydrogenase
VRATPCCSARRSLGFNTDGEAARDEILARVALAGREALVVGAGGAARAVALALKDAGARVLVANRGAKRGDELARLLGTSALPIEEIPENPDRILVQATSAPRTDPVVPPRARRAAFVLDVRYGEDEPALVRLAREAGSPAADGLGMLVRQAAAQVRLFTGEEVSARGSFRGRERGAGTALSERRRSGAPACRGAAPPL